MLKFPVVRFDFVFLILIGFLASSCSMMQAPTLEKAVGYGNTKDVRRHLNEGADVNKKNEQGQTPLHIAARNGSKNVAEVLIERGGEVDAKDNEGRTPLHLASENGHAPVIDLLITHKAQVNSRDKIGRTPLHHTALGVRGSNAALALISKKAGVDAQDKKGWTPLYLACLNNLPKMAELLINKGAKVNPTSGPTPLMGAVRDGHIRVVRVLLDNKAQVHGPATARQTPLHVAAEKGYLHIATLLMDHEASPNRKDSQRNTPLYYAIYNDRFHVIQELLDQGVNVNQKTREGTLLHLAAERGHAGAAGLLIQKGARLELKNSQGKKPLDVAINKGNRRVADLILRETFKQREIGK